MKFQEKSVLPKAQIFQKIREAVDAMEAGTFTVANQAVVFPEAAEIEFELKHKGNKREVEIEIKWYDS